MGILQEIFNFDDIGAKIKKWAKWSCWITILLVWISAAISFFILLFTEGTLLFAFLVPIAAILCSAIVWVCRWKIYAFGEYVENIQEMRNTASRIYNVDKNLKIIAQLMIDEANEKIKREAGEKIKQQAEAIVEYEVKEKAEQSNQKKRNNFSEKLEHALLFRTDEGMLRYLNGIQDETVQNILKSPKHLIREQIKNLLENM